MRATQRRRSLGQSPATPKPAQKLRHTDLPRRGVYPTGLIKETVETEEESCSEGEDKVNLKLAGGGVQFPLPA
jgi:hypothetical protein